MYSALWRALPGPTWVKCVEALVLAAAVVVLLFIVVFPWLGPHLPFGDVTVDSGAGTGPLALLGGWRDTVLGG